MTSLNWLQPYKRNIAKKWNSGQQQLDMGQSIQGWSE